VPFSRSFLETFLSAAVTVLLYLLGVNALSAGPLFAFFAPLPVTWSTCRNGRGAGLASLALSVSFTLPFLSLTAALSFAVGTAFLGWMLGSLLLGRAGLVRAAAFTAPTVIFLSFLFSALHFAAADLDPGTFLKHQVRELVLEAETSLEEISRRSDTGDSESVETLLRFFRLSLPSVLLVTIFLQCAAIGHLALLELSRRRDSRWKLPPLGTFSLPDWLVWILIPFIALQWAPSQPVRMASLNVTLCLLFLYLLQGLSVVIHFLRLWKTGKVLKMILVIILLLQPYLLALPLLAGLLDFKFKWRDRPRPSESAPPDGPPS